MNTAPFEPSGVLVLTARCPASSARGRVNRYLRTFPDLSRDRLSRYLRDHDKALSITGRLLLIEGLNRLGFAARPDLTVQYPVGKRPVLPTLPWVRFSISHSGEWVVCAVSQDLEVGIDLEQQNRVNVLAMSQFMTSSEWSRLEESNTPADLFQAYWTRKEAIIKAADRVAIDQFAQIDTSQPAPRFNGKRWHLTAVDIHPDYTCHLATDNIPTLQTIQLSF
jgi:4'-phosphopantetheinyl transferase